jgi:hypothetical protein
MKVEVEISEELARKLSYDLARDDYSAPELIAARVQGIVDRYGDNPRLVGRQHETAIAILRVEFVKRAAECAAPGESANTINWRAEAMLRAALGDE